MLLENTDLEIVITPQALLATRALQEIGRALQEQGVSLEELIESGRETRGTLVREQYGLNQDVPDN